MWPRAGLARLRLGPAVIVAAALMAHAGADPATRADWNMFCDPLTEWFVSPDIDESIACAPRWRRLYGGRPA